MQIMSLIESSVPLPWCRSWTWSNLVCTCRDRDHEPNRIKSLDSSVHLPWCRSWAWSNQICTCREGVSEGGDDFDIGGSKSMDGSRDFRRGLEPGATEFRHVWKRNERKWFVTYRLVHFGRNNHQWMSLSSWSSLFPASSSSFPSSFISIAAFGRFRRHCHHFGFRSMAWPWRFSVDSIFCHILSTERINSDSSSYPIPLPLSLPLPLPNYPSVDARGHYGPEWPRN